MDVETHPLASMAPHFFSSWARLKESPWVGYWLWRVFRARLQCSWGFDGRISNHPFDTHDRLNEWLTSVSRGFIHTLGEVPWQPLESDRATGGKVMLLAKPFSHNYYVREFAAAHASLVSDRALLALQAYRLDDESHPSPSFVVQLALGEITFIGPPEGAYLHFYIWDGAAVVVDGPSQEPTLIARYQEPLLKERSVFIESLIHLGLRPTPEMLKGDTLLGVGLSGHQLVELGRKSRVIAQDRVRDGDGRHAEHGS
jgi:hypothetical protein